MNERMEKLPINAPYPHIMKMRELIASNPMLLAALSRFGISLGFGESTIEEVCKSAGVDCDTFLAVANFTSGRVCDPSRVNPQALISYLRNAHSYFLDYQAPNIRQVLLQTVSTSDGSHVSLALIRFFDEYIAEIRRHMNFEERVFAYVNALISGEAEPDATLDDFVSSHAPIHGKLSELKELLICHFTAERGRVNLMNTLLYEIMNFENDLMTHCRLEDAVFVPVVRSLEQHGSTPRGIEAIKPLEDNGDVPLTAREREIVAHVARGMSNKEIAEALFLSVHTVATHRRNICSKLNLHSSSALTLYGILHGLT